ncbi:MAG TPA: hypothetical protein PLT03_03665 [Bacillota bacterium]|nr:hypothetical protein [Bacillota bacterium]HOG52952.1 hypothetical protein [Bacillota bacterium]
MSLMTIEQNRTDLLRLLGEPQTGGLFSEADLDHLLTNADNLNQAASEGWLMKADLLISSMPLASVGLGSESYKFRSAAEILDYCRERSRHYAKLAGKASGLILSLQLSTTNEAPV